MSTARLLAVLLVAWVAAGAPARAAEEDAAHIYQQRTPDGRVVLTDRPQAGARTQRSWTIAPMDAAEAARRREASRLEAAAVSERIARQLEAERAQRSELALARARLAKADAWREAERARAEAAADPAAIVVPVLVRRPFARHLPVARMHPGPGPGPRTHPRRPGMQPLP